MATRHQLDTSLPMSDQLATAIRRRIVAGDFVPGNKLPTFQEIESTFSVSHGVAQIAVERLKKDGFIVSTTRQGLYVGSNPPHLRRYGIVFPVTHADPTWSRFDEVLIREYRKLQQGEADRKFDVFSGVANEFREGPKVLERMRREVNTDLLAGMILTPGCFELAEQAPFSNPALPKVYLFGEQHKTTTTYPIVTGDGALIIDRSLQYLADKGCRRVALIRVKDAYSNIGEAFFRKHGLAYRSQWLQVVGRGDTAVIASLIPLLLDYPADQRPDGLFVLDDNLTDHVVAAVMATGLHIGKDIQIVSHCNWPAPSPNALPIRRIGYQVGHILRKSIESIDMMRRGETPQDVQRVPALFEDELQ